MGRRSEETRFKSHWVLDGNGRKLLVPLGTNPDHLPRTVYPFSLVTCDHILEQITKGKTINEIGMVEGFPPAHVIRRWMIDHPEFKANVKKARTLRADYYHDKVLEIAENAREKTVQTSKLKIETLKWAAEVADRETYGKQTKLVGDPENPLGFLVATGVPSEEKPIEVEYQKVDDKDQNEGV